MNLGTAGSTDAPQKQNRKETSAGLAGDEGREGFSDTPARKSQDATTGVTFTPLNGRTSPVLQTSAQE